MDKLLLNTSLNHTLRKFFVRFLTITIVSIVPLTLTALISKISSFQESFTISVLITLILLYLLSNFKFFKKINEDYSNSSFATGISLINEPVINYLNLEIKSEHKGISNSVFERLYDFTIFISGITGFNRSEQISFLRRQKSIERISTEKRVLELYSLLHNENLSYWNEFAETEFKYLKNRAEKLKQININWNEIIIDSSKNIEFMTFYCSRIDNSNSEKWIILITKLSSLKQAKEEYNIENLAHKIMATENIILFYMAIYLFHNKTFSEHISNKMINQVNKILKSEE